LVYGDIREGEILEKAAQGMDIIVHIAAGLKGTKSFILDSCIKGTSNVAEAARKARVKRVIYISSFSVYEYFRVKDGTIFNEESQFETQREKRSISAWAKCQAEDIALANLAANRPSWTILRPSLIFGNRRDVISLIGPTIGNFLISFGRRKKHVRLIHVKDVAKAILLTIENNSTCNCVFNLSHEDQITVNDIVRKCFQKSSLKKFHVVYLPYLVGILGVVIFKILRLILKIRPDMNRIRLAYLSRDILANSYAFRNTTNWHTENALLVQLVKEVEKVEQNDCN